MPGTLSKETVAVASGAVAATMGLASWAVYRQVKRYRVEPSPIAPSVRPSSGPAKRQSSVAVNSAFVRRFWSLLKIVIPSVVSREMGWLSLVAVMLGARTYCDLWMIRTTTNIERIIIGRMREQFPAAVFSYFLGIIPLAVVNNVLKYSLNEMSLCFRERLTAYFYDRYMQGFTFYTIQNVDGRLTNPDQILTQDLDRFCQGVADFYSNVSKPLIDMVIYAYKLTGAIGAQGPAYMLGYLALSGVVLTSLRRPLGRYTVWQQELEGDFRFVNARLLTNSEEIAFYHGNAREKATLTTFFTRLVNHIRHAMQFRFSMGIIDSVIAKYLSLVVGFYVVSRPFMNQTDNRINAMSQGERMQDYYRSGRMLMSLAGAVGRLTLATRELTRLAGFTARMSSLHKVLGDLNQNRYERTVVHQADDPSTGAVAGQAQSMVLTPKGVTYEATDLIRFENVPLITPNGDRLIESLNLEVRSGMNVLVCGPNGCGKSSMFRVLGGLWPLAGGVLHKPPRSKLFYVPQRPYLTIGTLRDQVIYPHSSDEIDCDDEQLRTYLRYVHLDYLVDRDGWDGWDTVRDWKDVLSGGEKQRLALARLFYNKPLYGILDECTSAVSVDVEGSMYELCREMGITLFTISHRKSLWRHHQYILYFDGRGNYKFCPREEMDIEYGS
eukprot:CAMPEP_0177681076 /NCGR_PEP_ID=MMETSP0447-20121125/30517_1 /TAXON_ID=0 /ORGANISM="Stygamoeba regulata, Strain BSH-02190019" /LENGTH=664 /DNA_ID=CAMNT_0019190457 /DNA_START=164 /DNA_END=2158 /DNA_ORIENTATION=+